MKSKRILAVSTTIVGLLAAVFLANTMLAGRQISALPIADTIVGPENTLPTVKEAQSLSVPTISGGIREPDSFLADGGRAAVIVKASSTVVQGNRGDSVTVPVTLSYRAGANAFTSVAVIGGHVVDGYIPASVLERTTPEDRVHQIQATGKIDGALDLDSTLSFPLTPIMLTPGQTSTVNLTINIPKAWPDDVVGQEIMYDFQFVKAGLYDDREFMIHQDTVNLLVTG